MQTESTPSSLDAAPTDPRERLEAGHFDTIIVGFCDIHGRWRGKMVPAERYRRNPTAPVQFSDIAFALDRAHEVVETTADLAWWPLGAGGFRDLLLWPDPDTLRAVPWRTRTALVLGSLKFRDGSSFPASPRDMLTDVGQVFAERALTPIVAAELEFVLFRQDEEEIREAGFPPPRLLHEQPMLYDVERFETDEELLLPILKDLQAMDFDIDCWSVEGGVSQYEFNWGHGDLVEAADRAFLFKTALRQLARRQGLTATFMAKSDANDYGSSMHLHQSLWSAEGVNAFRDPASDSGLSPLALNYMAGQLDTMRDLTCLFAPTVNSYKRYIPGNSAGMNATWGIENPMAGVRAIIDGEPGTRLEFRPPGADANPYLALTAALAGGLSGMERKLEPGAPSVGDASSDLDAAALPTDLGEAADLFERSDVARELLGKDFVEYYAATCRWESELGRTAVTDWERRRYLLGP